MAEIIEQSATKRVLLKAYLSDGVTEATGKVIAVVISKNGGAFANPSAGATNATEIASGWYYVDLSTTDSNTLGPLIVRGTAVGVDNTEVSFTVAAIPAANTGAIADRILGRNLAGGSDGGRTVQDALRPSRNKTQIVAGTLTVMEEDDVTPAWTAAVTTAAGNPITSVDPA